MSSIRSAWARLREELVALVIAIVAAGVIFGFVNFDNDGRDRLAAIVNAAGVGVAIFVLYLTYHSVRAARDSVRASREAVDEMRAARESAEQPRIVVYPVMTAGYKIDVIIENVGRSPATNVSVITAERDSQGSPVVGGAWDELKHRQLVGPGTYLPAGSSVRRIIMQGRPMEARGEFGFSRVDVTCEWEWPEMGSRRYSAVSSVDASILLDRYNPTPGSKPARHDA